MSLCIRCCQLWSIEFEAGDHRLKLHFLPEILDNTAA